jgi:hypothetical protein
VLAHFSPWQQIALWLFRHSPLLMLDAFVCERELFFEWVMAFDLF